MVGLGDFKIFSSLNNFRVTVFLLVLGHTENELQNLLIFKMISICSHFYFWRRNALSIEVSWLDTAKTWCTSCKSIQHLKPWREITHSACTKRNSTYPTFYFSFFEMVFNGRDSVLTVQYLYWCSYSVPVQSTIFFLCFGTKYKKQRIIFLLFCIYFQL